MDYSIIEEHGRWLAVANYVAIRAMIRPLEKHPTSWENGGKAYPSGYWRVVARTTTGRIIELPTCGTESTARLEARRLNLLAGLPAESWEEAAYH